MATKTKKRTKKKRTCPPGYHRVEIEAEPGTPVIDKETGEKRKKKFECVETKAKGAILEKKEDRHKSEYDPKEEM